MELAIPRLSRDPLSISLEVGEQLYVIGANGTGKSALFQHWVTSMDASTIKRISAHRQTWLPSGSLNFTAHSRRQFEENSMHWDRQDDARWMEQLPAERQSAVLFDLVAKDNLRYRTIGQHVDDQNPNKAVAFAAESMSLFGQLNSLLDLGTIRISLENSKDEEILAKHKDTTLSYSMAQMSDGERAATMMAASVLVADPGTTIFIDEPERHLHRSIIEPFLSALFGRRQDCAFVISTHEIALPIANPMAQILMLRSCEWQSKRPVAWDAKILGLGEHLPEDIRRDILGSRPRILFVEGTANSLDMPLYSTLFPELSVIPKGSCDDVVRAVKGLRSSYEHHHVEATGLIDRDDRTQNEVNELAQDNVFALDVYSVESLYYCSDAIRAVARRQADSLGRDSDEMVSVVAQKALKAIVEDADLAERMAARRSERRLASQIRRLAPDWHTIIHSNRYLQVPSTVESPYPGELERFRELVCAEDLDGLVVRYPLKESNVFDMIAASLECRNKANYERMVVALVREDKNLTRKLKDRIRALADLLDAERQHDT